MRAQPAASVSLTLSATSGGRPGRLVILTGRGKRTAGRVRASHLGLCLGNAHGAALGFALGAFAQIL